MRVYYVETGLTGSFVRASDEFTSIAKAANCARYGGYAFNQFNVHSNLILEPDSISANGRNLFAPDDISAN